MPFIFDDSHLWKISSTFMVLKENSFSVNNRLLNNMKLDLTHDLKLQDYFLTKFIFNIFFVVLRFVSLFNKLN